MFEVPTCPEGVYTHKYIIAKIITFMLPRENTFSLLKVANSFWGHLN